jgi:type II secretory pathway pseudopilin PulG
MASRENTTLQGVVIALVLLLLLMFVGLFLLNNARKTEQSRANDASTQAQQAQSSLGELQAEANSYKTWMGFNEDDTLETIQKSFEEDIAKYGASFEENDRFYSPLLANLSEENKNLSKSEATAKSENKQLKEKLLATEKEKDLQIQQFSKEAAKAVEDLKAERAKFDQSRAAMNAENQKLSQQLADQRAQIDKVNADASTATKKQLEEVTAMKQDIEILRGNQLDPDPFAQPEDGLISWVNQKEGKVWINIGEADALRPQVTFSVYSGDEADALKADTKGSIEVTKILSPHLAEARITSDIPTRPLMEGDKIYSQVWNRGRQVGFALAGILDMDGDGKNDIDELKTVIALNNGKVDAQPAENGEVAGQMTVDTRYLILGKFPEGSIPNAENQRLAWETMNEAADRLGIETITLDEFLNLMGWKSDRRTVTLGPSAKPDDFPAKKPGDYKPPRTSAGAIEFRPRKPQPTY